MGTRVITDRGPVSRGNVEIGIDAGGAPFARLGGRPVEWRDGEEVVREGNCEGRPIRDRLRMDAVGPAGRQAARYVYCGEVRDDDPRTAGAHYLTCWVPMPDTARRFEVAEDCFESARDVATRRLVRWGLLVGLAVMLIVMLVVVP